MFPIAIFSREADERDRFDDLIRAEYERCRPDDTLMDLKRRARFTKEDKGLLGQWRALAAQRDREMCEALSGAMRIAAE